MTEFDDTAPDEPMTPEAEAQQRLLTAAQLRRIDECLLSHTSHQWHKVAYVIGQTMKEIYDEFHGIPDVFYGLRIKHLAESGVIEAAGNLNRMRYSEIRLPEKQIAHKRFEPRRTVGPPYRSRPVQKPTPSRESFINGAHAARSWIS